MQDGKVAMASCVTDERAEDYSAGMAKMAEDGAVSVKLVSSQPMVDGEPGAFGPPARHDNLWELEVTDANGEPIADADVSIKTWMPDHGHPSNRASVVHWVEGAQYEVNPLNLMMPGIWEITVNVEDTNAGISDSVKFTFCVE